MSHEIKDKSPDVKADCGQAAGSVVCECINWCARNVVHGILTGHHEDCPRGPKPLDAALALVREMAKGMERWAADEDGIHPDAWEAYRRAKAMEGVFLPEDPDSPNTLISNPAVDVDQPKETK